MEESQAASPRTVFVRSGWFRAAVVVLVAVVATGIAIVVTHGSAGAVSVGCGGGVPKLTVQGQGTASGTPRTLQLDADVQVNASSAQAAMAQDNSIMASVIAALEAQGVAKKDIAATDLTVNPNYQELHGQSVISGYGVDNSISVTIRHLGRAGGVIDAATGAGGDALNISSLQFTMTDPRVLQDKARHDAVAQAVGHAGAMAAAAGQRLGPVCQLTDDTSVSPIQLREPASPAFAASAAGTNVPLQPGTQQATAQITLVYALQARSAG